MNSSVRKIDVAIRKSTASDEDKFDSELNTSYSDSDVLMNSSVAKFDTAIDKDQFDSEFGALEERIVDLIDNPNQRTDGCSTVEETKV